MQASLSAALAAALLPAAPAAAQTDQAWNNWVYRTNSILGAIKSGSSDRVNLVCRDIRGEMGGKGFPDWATGLIHVCDALKEGLNNGRSRAFCNRARNAAAVLGGASPVNAEPRAYPLAQRLEEAMRGLHQGMC